MNKLCCWAVALILSGCVLSRPLRVEGNAALPEPDVEAVLSLAASDLHESPDFFKGLVVRFTREPSRLGEGVVGWTPSPWNVWVRVTDARHDVCKTTLVHELLHVWLWRKYRDPDPFHTTSGVWDRKNAALSVFEAEQSTEARLYRHVCQEVTR